MYADKSKTAHDKLVMDGNNTDTPFVVRLKDFATDKYTVATYDFYILVKISGNGLSKEYWVQVENSEKL